MVDKCIKASLLVHNCSKFCRKFQKPDLRLCSTTIEEVNIIYSVKIKTNLPIKMRNLHINETTKIILKKYLSINTF